MAAETTQTWTAGEPERPALHRAAESIGKLDALDAPAKAIGAKVRELLKPGPLKDALSGTWLGHPLHPLMTDVALGAWMSAAVLDAVGGEDSEPAAERLIAVGLAAALPTFWSGWSDWADTEPAHDDVRRIGVVHAASNGLGAVLFAGSLAARRAGRRGRGKLMAMGAMGALGLGGHLGGHLSYAKGVAVDVTAFESGPEEWTATVAEDEVREGEAAGADAAGVPVVLTRHDGRIYAISNTCTHRGGSLADGEVSGGCVTCPLHASIFRFEDGSVERGPASIPQRAFDVRVMDGTVEVREHAAL